MAKIEVTISEMVKAANTLTRAADDFLKTANDALGSADALGQCWEGDSQVAFITEQTKANEWYKEMTNLVRDYVSALRSAADDYSETDTSAAALIKKK